MKNDQGKRRRAYRSGLSAERIAAWYLRLKGYAILATRYRAADGEVDIVARRRHDVIFVEVKARATMASAQLAITPLKRRRFSHAVRAFLGTRPELIGLTYRADAIFIAPWRLPLHLPHAFEIDGL